MALVELRAKVGRRRDIAPGLFVVAEDWETYPDSTWGNATALDGTLRWRQGEDLTVDQGTNGWRIRDGIGYVGAGGTTAVGITTDTLNTQAAWNPRRLYIARCEVGLDTSDMYVRGTFGTSGGTANSSNWFGLIARVGESETPDHYFLQVRGDGSLRLLSVVGGVETFITSVSHTHTAGDVYELRCHGSTISARVNDTEVISETDSAVESGSKGGLRARTTNTNSAHRCLAWRAGKLDEEGDPVEGPVSTALPMLLWATQVSQTTTTARISCQIRNTSAVRIVVSENETLVAPVYVSDYEEPDELELAGFEPDGLDPGTSYFYGLQVVGKTVGEVRRLRTAPSGQTSFTVVMGGDAAPVGQGFGDHSRTRNTANAPVYEKVVDLDPAFYFWAGDRHYRDYNIDHPAPHLLALRDSYENPRLDALTAAMPIIQMWDDHDFTGDSADIGTTGRDAAVQVFRAAVPAGDWLVDDALGPVGFTFTWGRTRWIILDHRSGGTSASKLGSEQLAALLDLLETATEPLIFLHVGVPWISDSSSDTWFGGGGSQRQTIADAIETHAKGRVAILHADSHMLAIDDGTNSQYASGASAPGPPVLCAAPVYTSMSIKGGPYSEGTIPPEETGGIWQQYAVIDVDDQGHQIQVTWTGYQLDENEDESVVIGPFQFIVAVGGS